MTGPMRRVRFPSLRPKRVARARAGTSFGPFLLSALTKPAFSVFDFAPFGLAFSAALACFCSARSSLESVCASVSFSIARSSLESVCASADSGFFDLRALARLSSFFRR